MKKPDSYEAAYAELQEILQIIQNPESGIDDLAEKMARAQELLDFCRKKLRNLEETLPS